jgi:hypothetical protein
VVRGEDRAIGSNVAPAALRGWNRLRLARGAGGVMNKGMLVIAASAMVLPAYAADDVEE